MRRRSAASFVALSALFVPALAVALPRPQGAQQTAPETQVASITLLGNDPVGQETPTLTSGRSYRFEVSGVWKPSGAANNFADAGFETTDGVNWNKTGKGLVVAATNYGSPSNPTLSSVRGDHKYSIPWTGRGQAELLRLNDPTGYSDNSGSVTVTIFQQSIVTYVFPITRRVEPRDHGAPSQITASVPPLTVPVPGVPTTTVSPVPVPGVILPLIGSVQLYQSGSLICLSVTVLGTPPTTLACALNPGNLIPPTTVPIGGRTVTGPTTICQSPPCVVPGIPPGGITVGGQTITVPIPPGSTVTLTFTWTGDNTRLWLTPVDDGTGQNRLMAPFNPLSPQERAWFQANAASVGASISALVTRTDGTVVFSQELARVSGLGQVLEAMFETRVGGQ